jgi:hypothetical protein
MWLIWEKFALTQMAGAILSILSLILSIVAGALFAEHFLKFLKRQMTQPPNHPPESAPDGRCSFVQILSLAPI